MRRSIALAIALLATAACSGDGPTGGSGLSGTFDLEAIDGVPPPKLEFVNMSLDTMFTTGGEIRVLSRGRIAMVRRIRWHSHVNGPLAEDADTVIVAYDGSGPQLLLHYPVSVPRGPYTDTATVQGDAITVQTKIFGAQLGTVFVRSYRYARR
jgi:hypothetical protein